MVTTQPSSAFPATPLEASAIATFRSGLKGEAFLPGDEGYADAIFCWSVLVRHEPVLAVMPETAADVARAVAFAVRHDLPVGVQGSGHGQPVPCIGGVLINTARMQGVTIDPANQSARVEAGVKWGQVIPLAQQHGLAPLNGSSSDVGVIGYTLGGGHGWLARKYGRAADRILAADIVTTDGEMVHITEETEPDLFWALKGGSGNFGIVTALEFEMVPLQAVFGGSVMYPLANAHHVFTEFSRWSRTLPEEITTSISIMRFPPLPQLPPMLRGLSAVVVRACAVGDLKIGEALIQPMRDLPGPIVDTFGVMPYTAIDAISMDPTDPMPVRSTTMMLADLDEVTIDALLTIAGPDVESPLLMIDIRDLRTSDGEDTRAHVAGLPVYAIGVAANTDLAAALEGAITAMHEALRPFTTDRVLLNFLGDGDFGPARTRAAFPEADFARLQEMKRRYDRENRFRFNHNITP